MVLGEGMKGLGETLPMGLWGYVGERVLGVKLLFD
jgi:hypothetical protein